MEDTINYQKNLENCIFVKTILMMLVIVYHSMVFWGGDWFNVKSVAIECNVLKYLALWLNSFHIYGFVFISGYLFEYLKREKNKYQKFFAFIVNKSKRLLIPYIFVAIVWVIPISSIWNLYTTNEIFTKFILCVGPSQLWFLWMLFDVFIIIWLIYKWTKSDLGAIIISILSWGIGIIGGKLFLNIFCIWTAFTYLPYFILGMKIREKKTFCLYKILKYFFVIIQIFLFVLWQIIGHKEAFIFKLLSIVFQYSTYIFGALMSFFVLQWLAEKVNWRNNELFMTLAKQSMTIYLFHQQIIYFTISCFNGKINPYLNVIVNFIVAIFFSSLISKFLMNFKCTRVLIGEKN